MHDVTLPLIKSPQQWQNDPSVSLAPQKSLESYFCGHCKEEVSKTLFFQHRKLYYDKRNGEWKTKRVIPSDLGEDFDFEEAKDTTQGTA